jgi:hypothetical protein
MQEPTGHEHQELTQLGTAIKLAYWRYGRHLAVLGLLLVVASFITGNRDGGLVVSAPPLLDHHHELGMPDPVLGLRRHDRPASTRQAVLSQLQRPIQQDQLHRCQTGRIRGPHLDEM